MSTEQQIRTAQSCAIDSRVAVREFHAGVQQPALALVIFFCSGGYELDAVADEMNRLFDGVRVVGGTSAGEIGPLGYRDCGISGVSFGPAAGTAGAGRLGRLQQFEIRHGQEFAQSLLEQFESAAPDASPQNSFGLLLIDGLSRREEPVAPALQNALGKLALIGVPVGDLTPLCFAASPMVVAIDGTDYVRSIQKANPDRSLTFYCAIDVGLVLRAVRGVDLLGNLEQAFAALRADLGPPQLVFACDCILRKLEITQAGARDAVSEVFRQNRVIGFSTYGEQFRGVHVNQTLTGLALGSPREAGDD